MFAHRRWKWIVVALLALATPLFAQSPPASGGGSPLGRYLFDHGYQSVPVDYNGHNQQSVKVQINGSSATLVLDTGCGRTSITDKFAHNLKMDVMKADAAVGVGGRLASGGVAFLQSFTLNNQAINRTETIRVLPPHSAVTGDGLLGYDYMRLNAVILPVGMGYFLYKPALAEPPYFENFLTAAGYQAIPLTYGEGGLRAEGSLNGHPLIAVVDCGANYTLFDANFVQSVGAYVTKSRLISWGIDGRPMFIGIFNADKLTFGGLTFPPTKTTTAAGTTLTTIHAQALLGYDLLAQHRAIIDLGHNVLWMK